MELEQTGGYPGRDHFLYNVVVTILDCFKAVTYSIIITYYPDDVAVMFQNIFGFLSPLFFLVNLYLCTHTIFPISLLFYRKVSKGLEKIMIENVTLFHFTLLWAQP